MSEDLTGYPGAPPDWYPDPAGGPGKRWWDGYSWSEAILPSEPAPPIVPPPVNRGPEPPLRGYGVAGYGTPWYSTEPVGYAPGLLNEELKISRMARIAVATIGIYYLWDAINLVLQPSFFRSIGRWYHRVIVASQNHQTAPKLVLHSKQGLADFGSLLGIATIAAVIFACIWQHRAASTARALGYPAKHTPGWGVGCWFVPIVAYWMPYQALRDCLPLDDPNRRLVARFWFYFLAQSQLLFIGTITAMFTSSAILFFCIPAGLCCLGMITTAPQLVVAIGAAHQSALGHPGAATPMP